MKTDNGEKPAKPAKPKKPKAKPVVVTEFVSIKHIYSAKEREAITGRLTSALNNVAEQEQQSKAVAADFKAKIKTGQSVVSEASNQLTTGYEMRQVKALVKFDKKKGVKTLYYNDPTHPLNGKKIRKEPMLESDYSLLPLDVTPKPPEPKAKKKKADAAQPLTGAENPDGGEPENGADRLAA